MSPEWLTAIATAGTFVVIAASAIAALMQLRHMRTGNQIAAYNECRETMDSPEFRTALQFIRSQLPQRLGEQALIDEILGGGFAGEYGGIRMVANLFESTGLFVRTGMMDERIACELWSTVVLTTWEALRPLTAAVRNRFDRGTWVNFEYMAVLSKRYNERFPAGEYPRGFERVPLDEGENG